MDEKQIVEEVLPLRFIGRLKVWQQKLVHLRAAKCINGREKSSRDYCREVKPGLSCEELIQKYARRNVF
jgi:hypothetical protein